MVTGLHLCSIILVCLLNELEQSSAFPKGRASVYPKAWQGLREQQQETGNPGTRPLKFIQTLRQAHRKKQPKAHKVWVNPRQSFLSYSKPQTQPSVNHETQNPKHTNLPKGPSERLHSTSIPRSFVFSLKVPFDGSADNKGTSQTTTGSSTNGSGIDGHSSQSYRPTSVELHSSFNKPSGSDGFLGKGSTKDPNERKNVHKVSKPSFELSFSVPIPSTTQSPKPSSNDAVHFTKLQRPGTSGSVQNSYPLPSNPQSTSTQSESERTLLNQVQQRTEQLQEPVHTKPTESKAVTFFPGYVDTHPTEQIIQGNIPGHSRESANLVGSPVPLYPQQFDTVYSGSDASYVESGGGGQTVSPYPTKVDLALPPSHSETVSGYHSAAQVKPSGNYHGQHQTWQHNTGSYSSPIHSSQYGLPHYPTSNVVYSGQTDLSSAHQYGKGQSGQYVLTDSLLAASHSSPSFPDLSTRYQSHVSLPGQQTGQMTRNPSYAKLFVDVEDVLDVGDGQKYFTAPSAYYDGYSGLREGETHVGQPSPVSANPQSLIPVSQGQVTGLLGPTIETFPSQKQDSYIPGLNQALSMDSGVGQYNSFPQNHMQTEKFQTGGYVPGQVTANTGQQQMQPTIDHSPNNYYSVSPSNLYHVGQLQWPSAESYYYTSPVDYYSNQIQIQQPTIDQTTNSYYTFSPSHGYHVGQMQPQLPTRHQSTNYYPISLNRLNPYNQYRSNY